MAATGEATQPLKYNTWVLKVPIHCVGCKREVKKLLKNIEGVYSTTIDSQMQKVTVTGNVDSEILIKKLMKAGKHAEMWSEKSAEKPKKTEKPQEPKNAEKKGQANTAETNFNTKNAADDSETKLPVKNNTKEVKQEKKGKENNPASAAAAVPASNGGSGGKLKKGKELKGNAGCNQSNGTPTTISQPNINQSRCTGPQLVTLSPAFDQFNTIQGPPAVHMMNYAAYPTKPGHGLAYQVPISPTISFNACEQMVSYHAQATAFTTFDIFSDENPNGCSIM